MIGVAESEKRFADGHAAVACGFQSEFPAAFGRQSEGPGFLSRSCAPPSSRMVSSTTHTWSGNFYPRSYLTTLIDATGSYLSIGAFTSRCAPPFDGVWVASTHNFRWTEFLPA